MTDLSTLLACITLLIMTVSVLRFLRWFYKNESALCDELNDYKVTCSELRTENAELKRKAVNTSERLSDIY